MGFGFCLSHTHAHVEVFRFDPHIVARHIQNARQNPGAVPLQVPRPFLCRLPFAWVLAVAFCLSPAQKNSASESLQFQLLGAHFFA